MERSRIQDGVKLPLFDSEKQEPLEIDERATSSSPPRTTKQKIVLGWYIIVFLVLARGAFNLLLVTLDGSTQPASGRQVESYWAAPEVPVVPVSDSEGVCKQADLLPPSKHAELFEILDKLYQTDTFKFKAYEALGGAVKIPTETFDDVGAVGEDPRWEMFGLLHEFLAKEFPLVHENLELTKVHSYALVYHWQGSNTDLKPILLAAHQDVVPVLEATLSEWKQPPFSGLYDGEWIWGRGSCDDKSGLIGIMVAIEMLVELGFKPQRSVVLAFGMDEERGGTDGAKYIADYLLETYGEDSISVLVDEGGLYQDVYGGTFAIPAVAEKGHLNIMMEVSAPGGHSSVPPKHTTIGILAGLITELEANPHENHFHRDRTYYEMFQCFAEHSPSMPPPLRQLIKKSQSDDDALSKLEEYLTETLFEFAASTGTTQAVDIIGGGVKVNALPEKAFAIVNHRIADYSSVDELKDRFISIVSPVAEQYNLSVNAFGTDLNSDSSTAYRGVLALSDTGRTGLEPAPVSPTKDSEPWDILSGTIKYVIETAHRNDTQYKNAHVAPGLAIGNTDTKFYWNLTKHIFRYNHRAAGDGYNGAHTVNEAIRAEGFIEMIRFYTVFILNTDEAKNI